MCETAVWTGLLESRTVRKSCENWWIPLEPQRGRRSSFSMWKLLWMRLLSQRLSRTFHRFSWSSCTRESQLSKPWELLRIIDFQFRVSCFQGFWFLINTWSKRAKKLSGSGFPPIRSGWTNWSLNFRETVDAGRRLWRQISQESR